MNTNKSIPLFPERNKSTFNRKRSSTPPYPMGIFKEDTDFLYSNENNQSSSLHETVFNLPFGIFIFNSEGKLEYENYFFKTLTGYSILEKDNIESWLISNSSINENKDEVINNWRKYVWRNQSKFIFKIKSNNGEIHNIEFNPTLNNDGGISVVAQDITEKIKSETLQREINLKFKYLFSNSDSVILVNKFGQIIDANRAACKLINIDIRNLRASNISNLFAPSDNKRFLKNLSHKLSIHSPNNTFVLTQRGIKLLSDNKPIDISLTYCPIGNSPKNPTSSIYFLKNEINETKKELILKLKNVLKKFKSFLNTIPDIVLFIDYKTFNIIDYTEPLDSNNDLPINSKWKNKTLSSLWPNLKEILIDSKSELISGKKSINADVYFLKNQKTHLFNAFISLSNVDKVNKQFIVIIRNNNLTNPNSKNDSFFETLPYPALIVKPSTEIVDLNQKAQDLIKIQKNKLIGEELSSRFTAKQTSKYSESNTHEGTLEILNNDKININIESFPIDNESSDTKIGVILKEKNYLAESFNENITQKVFIQEDSQTESPQSTYRNNIQLITSLFSFDESYNHVDFQKWQIRLRALSYEIPSKNKEPIPTEELINNIAKDIKHILDSKLSFDINSSVLKKINFDHISSFALLISEIIYIFFTQATLNCEEDSNLNIFLKEINNNFLNIKFNSKSNSSISLRSFNQKVFHSKVCKILINKMKGNSSCQIKPGKDSIEIDLPIL